MPVPRSPHVSLFVHTSEQRLEDALILLENQRTTGAVYVAGYGVECILKALLLSAHPERKQLEVIHSFRGSKAHDFEWLRDQYLRRAGIRFPMEIVRHFVHVNTWRTDMRYRPGTIKYRDAKAFLGAALSIIRWGKGRL